MDREGDQSYYGRPLAGSGMSTGLSTAVPTPNRPSSPSGDGYMGRNPFGDGIESQASHRGPLGGGSSGGGPTNPFASPSGSRPPSSFGSSSAIGTRFEERSQRYFHSRRVAKGSVEKPWLAKANPREKWVTILPILGILVGLGISGFLVWDGIRSVVKHNYCPILKIENFDGGLDPAIWDYERQVGGFGNGQFDMTTDSPDNVFVEGGKLVIRATVQDEKLINENSKIDLLADKSCTSTVIKDCIAVTNTTVGNATIVPPARSARVHTRKGASIRYGRVEVTAKLPKGDWLWPAIWMMPVDDTYGAWPLSGEIDIVESRGNNYSHPQGGNTVVSSALHWGPNPANDAWWRTNNKRQALHTTYADGFNTFGLEWSKKYLFTYVNSRLYQVLYTNFDEPLWRRGGWTRNMLNGTSLDQLWGQGGDNAPFDQRFYLILNLAVGGTNGWFLDNAMGKPWLDGSPKARKDFWEDRDSWLPTWTAPQMEISKIVMEQENDGNLPCDQLGI